MRKQLFKVGAALACAVTMLMGSLAAPSAASAVGTGSSSGGYVEIYRLYNKYTGEHFYTYNASERNSLSENGWNYEGVGFYVWGIGWDLDEYAKVEADPITNPVYRLYNPYVPGGDHHYTMDENEYNELVKYGWRQEDIAWQACSQGEGTIPVYRLYNPNALSGAHHYTTDDHERQELVKAGWKDEGIAMYSYADPNSDGVRPSDFKGDIDYENVYFSVELPPAKTDSYGVGNGWNDGEWAVDQLSDTSWRFYEKPRGDWDTYTRESTIYVGSAPEGAKYIGTTSGGQKVWGVDKMESYGSGETAGSYSHGFFKYDGEGGTYDLARIALK